MQTSPSPKQEFICVFMTLVAFYNLSYKNKLPLKKKNTFFLDCIYSAVFIDLQFHSEEHIVAQRLVTSLYSPSSPFFL